MSSGLIVADQGSKVTLKNSWGDVALNTVRKRKTGYPISKPRCLSAGTERKCDHAD